MCPHYRQTLNSQLQRRRKIKKTNKIAGVIAIVTIIGLGFTACDNGGGGEKIEGENCYGADCRKIGSAGPGGGIIIYHVCAGFTVTGKGSFTAYYLEAAPNNQGTSLAWALSSFIDTNIAGTGTAIGTGKANTAAILAVDANAPAALACNNYNGGGKSDWFLPSRLELNEMYRARTHLGVSSGWFWSSSQFSDDIFAWVQDFVNGVLYGFNKGLDSDVRAVRAF